MKKTVRAAFVLTLLLLIDGVVARSQPPVQRATADAAALPTVARKTAAMRHIVGLLPLDWDAKAGRLYLELALANGRSRDLLYTESLPYGVGSSDIGLDRGEISPGLIVHFERIGAKVLLVEPNLAFRSSSEDA